MPGSKHRRESQVFTEKSGERGGKQPMRKDSCFSPAKKDNWPYLDSNQSGSKALCSTRWL